MNHAQPTDEPDTAFGFWMYLLSDAILFGLLFATYAVMSGNTAGGPAGAALFDLRTLTAETALLLTSTLTMAFAHAAAVARKQSVAIGRLALTGILGAGFLALELRELSGLISIGAGPGRSGFLSAFFTLVGTHGLHVAVGVIWSLVMIAQLALKGVTPRGTDRLYRLSLFWHFLDIIWVGVFSVVYLAGIVG